MSDLLGIFAEPLTGEATLVRVVGEVDVATAPKLLAEIEDLLARGTRLVVLELSGVDFLDGFGLRALEQAKERLTRGDGWLLVRNPSKVVLQVLEFTGSQLLD